MKTSWKDMNKKEKVIYVVYCIIAFIGTAAAVVDMMGKWAHADVVWMIAIAIACMIDCLQNWNHRRKIAILEAVAGILVLVCGIAGKLL